MPVDKTHGAPAYAPFTPEPMYQPTWLTDAPSTPAPAADGGIAARDAAIARVIRHEGGYGSHPSDPGGATHYGITTATARRHGYQGAMQLLPRSEAVRIYRILWAESGAERFANAQLGASAFDAYVSHGPRARRWYAVADDASGCIALNAKRLAVYRASRNWRLFGRGWSKRLRYNSEQCSEK